MCHEERVSVGLQARHSLLSSNSLIFVPTWARIVRYKNSFLLCCVCTNINDLSRAKKCKRLPIYAKSGTVRLYTVYSNLLMTSREIHSWVLFTVDFLTIHLLLVYT